MKEVFIDNEICMSSARHRIARCIQCGYDICDGDDAAVVIASGDAIHRDCWEDYAQENIEDFLKEI